MSLYVDANYTVDDAGYFLDVGDPLYVECGYWLTAPDQYVEGDNTCPIIVTIVSGGGGLRPYYDVVVVGWGAIRAYPQVIFDFVLETPPRGIPEPAPVPVFKPMPVSDQARFARYAEAAAAFDLELVRRYLEAVGIDLDG